MSVSVTSCLELRLLLSAVSCCFTHKSDEGQILILNYFSLSVSINKMKMDANFLLKINFLNKNESLTQIQFESFVQNFKLSIHCLYFLSVHHD